MHAWRYSRPRHQVRVKATVQICNAVGPTARVRPDHPRRRPAFTTLGHRRDHSATRPLASSSGGQRVSSSGVSSSLAAAREAAARDARRRASRRRLHSPSDREPSSLSSCGWGAGRAKRRGPKVAF